jgi:hypothetical protein
MKVHGDGGVLASLFWKGHIECEHVFLLLTIKFLLFIL